MGGGPHSMFDLSTILTPQLFHALHKLRFPWPHNQQLPAADVVDFTFGNGMAKTNQTAFDLTFHPVLKPLSELSISSLPDLLTFLPDPSANDFPEQALGFVLCLDQMPRQLIHTGTNLRYILGHFDILSRRLLEQLMALPWSVRPDNPALWLAAGYTVDNIVLRRIMLYAPLAHSETFGHHMLALGTAEELRRDVECYFCVEDYSRSLDLTDMSDVLALPSVLSEGPPDEAETRVEMFLFYFLRVVRIHEPIVRKFGRTPGGAKILGLESTEEEIEWLEKTNWFGSARGETAKRIREDVEKGVWTPLMDEPVR